MPTNPVAVVAAIETSQAMQASGFGVAAQISASAFVSDLLAGDAVGVGSVGSPSAMVYPGSGGIAVVDSTLSQLTAATQTINALTFTAASADIAGGLTAAFQALAAAPAGDSKGVLLISTGQYGTNPDPLKLSTYLPTYACAAGQTANQTMLTQLANLSGGTYHYAPQASDMAGILLQIRGVQPGWATALVASTTVATLGFWLKPVNLPSNVSSAQFSIIWEDPTLAWTGSTNPVAGQIAVTLVQPSPPGLTLSAASLSGPGWCTYNLPTPAAGQWYVQVMYPGTANPVSVTAGVFYLPGGTVPRLRLAARATGAGAPIVLEARLEDVADTVEIESATLETVVPRRSLQELLDRHSDEIGLQPSDCRETALARLRAFAQASRPRDIFEHRRNKRPLPPPVDFGLTTTVTDSAVAGSFTCRVHLVARDRISGDMFEITESLSATVPSS